MTTECGKCKKSFPTQKMFECEFCNKQYDSDEDYDDSDEGSNNSVKVADDNEPKILLCRRCSDECFVCELRGCEECLRTVCCDCSVSMCKKCRNGDDMCGCYGNCYWCNREVDRGSDGWPCDECDRWGCRSCRIGNGCKECDPEYESDESEEEEEEMEKIEIEIKEEIEKEPEDVQSLKEKITKLESEIQKLKCKNEKLKDILDARNEKDSENILNHFYAVNSIRQTAWEYGMEMEDLYELIPQWCGCYDRLHMANDFEECRIEVIGRREYDEEKEADLDSEDFENRNRKPNADETNKILSDYECGQMSLYKLADKYDLQINNLFLILKENGKIEKETDAKGYASFYREYFGVGYEWDGKNIIGLLSE